MVFLVMLSAGVTFAADDAADVIAVDDEISMEEPLAIDESQIVSANETSTADNVVTKDNFNNYFDENGTLLANVTAEELTFSGDISDVGVDTIVLDRAISVFGDNSTLTNIAIDVKADNVVISGLTLNQNNGTYAISATNATGVEISNSTINFNAVSNADGYAIKADTISKLNLLNNAITYVGATIYSGINNGILVSNSSEVNIKGNKFNLSLVSAAVAWFEVPAGSGNWVSAPITEGIVVDSSSEVIFEDNVVDVVYNSVSGSYDTIYAIDFKDSAYTAISGNNITVSGHTYTYGIILSGFNFVIDSNTIVAESDVYYANGIDIEGPAFGEIKNNDISVKGFQSVYGIYSGMNGQNVTATYINNTIAGEGYNVFGMSLGDVESQIEGSNIALDGNYTTGIAYYGNKINVTGSNIILNSSEVGNESIWESFGVEAVGVKVIKGEANILNNIIVTQGKGVSFTGNETNVNLENNFINVVGNVDKDAYAIYAVGIPGFRAVNNTIDYKGMTQGTGFNYGVYLNNATAPLISDNKFDLNLVSSYVPWIEIPAGSSIWVSFPVSEGIVIEDSVDADFSFNEVNVTYSEVVGSYDTIYSVDFKNSISAKITSNNITANGHTYIYGLIISGDDFVISSNDIVSSSDIYYANGIDIEGPANGLVENNNIDVKSPVSVYAVYSGMNGQNVTATYINNTIAGEGYNAFGFSLGDVESVLVKNNIDLIGNYTTGIAYRGSSLTVDNNTISAVGSGVGSESIWESFGVENIGIKVTQGKSTIVNNTVTTTGSYPVSVANTNASVHDNFLVGVKFVGDEGVKDAANSEVYNNTPTIENKTATSITLTEIDGDCNITGIVTDADGNPIKNGIINYSVNGINGTVTSDASGVFKITGITNGKVTIEHAGDSYLDNATVSITLKDIAPVREATVINGNNFTQYAIEYSANERGGNFTVQLVDANGNVLANKVVLIGYNGKTLERITDENGYASVQINLKDANRLTFAVTFLGDDRYEASMSVYLITINKKPVTITAAAKSYKATAKTKKYTVTLSTIKGASADGKTYFAAGKKVTMKVNGKTYTAKTNGKGQATFALKLTKKGKFAATISYAGDTTYNSASKTVKYITIK